MLRWPPLRCFACCSRGKLGAWSHMSECRRGRWAWHVVESSFFPLGLLLWINSPRGPGSTCILMSRLALVLGCCKLAALLVRWVLGRAVAQRCGGGKTRPLSSLSWDPARTSAGLDGCSRPLLIYIFSWLPRWSRVSTRSSQNQRNL